MPRAQMKRMHIGHFPKVSVNEYSTNFVSVIRTTNCERSERANLYDCYLVVKYNSHTDFFTVFL